MPYKGEAGCYVKEVGEYIYETLIELGPTFHFTYLRPEQLTGRRPFVPYLLETLSFLTLVRTARWPSKTHNGKEKSSLSKGTCASRTKGKIQAQRPKHLRHRPRRLGYIGADRRRPASSIQVATSPKSNPRARASTIIGSVTEHVARKR